jgi:hypothetical protein
MPEVKFWPKDHKRLHIFKSFQPSSSNLYLKIRSVIVIHINKISNKRFYPSLLLCAMQLGLVITHPF